MGAGCGQATGAAAAAGRGNNGGWASVGGENDDEDLEGMTVSRQGFSLLEYIEEIGAGWPEAEVRARC